MALILPPTYRLSIPLRENMLWPNISPNGRFGQVLKGCFPSGRHVRREGSRQEVYATAAFRNGEARMENAASERQEQMTSSPAQSRTPFWHKHCAAALPTSCEARSAFLFRSDCPECPYCGAGITYPLFRFTPQRGEYVEWRCPECGELFEEDTWPIR